MVLINTHNFNTLCINEKKLEAYKSREKLPAYQVTDSSEHIRTSVPPIFKDLTSPVAPPPGTHTWTPANPLSLRLSVDTLALPWLSPFTPGCFLALAGPVSALSLPFPMYPSSDICLAVQVSMRTVASSVLLQPDSWS